MCDDDQEAYVQALCKELALRNAYLPSSSIATVYFGGGTPSLLSIEQFETIFGTIKAHFTIEDGAEITLEANPDDLSLDYLTALRQLGFNRLSIGIQSFDDDDLKLINRRHSGQDAISALKNAQKVGFDNISGDLIFGLPHQTLAKWQQNIDTMLSLNVQHISCYNLSYEEGTAFYEQLMEGQFSELDDETSLQMYQLLIEVTKAHGFEHYETSNFAKEKRYSKHNSHYWKGQPYLGLGAGAHSYNGTERSWNVSDNEDYIRGIMNGDSVNEIEHLDKRTRYNEFIMTGLRTMWGCSLITLNEEFGENYQQHTLDTAEKHLSNDNLIIENNILRIAPSAIFISDQIMSDLMMI